MIAVQGVMLADQEARPPRAGPGAPQWSRRAIAAKAEHRLRRWGDWWRRYFEHERGWGEEAPYQRMLRIGKYQPGNLQEHFILVPEMDADIEETQRIVLEMATVHQRTLEAVFVFDRDQEGYAYDNERRARELLKVNPGQFNDWLYGARQDFQRRLRTLLLRRQA